MFRIRNFAFIIEFCELVFTKKTDKNRVVIACGGLLSLLPVAILLITWMCWRRNFVFYKSTDHHSLPGGIIGINWQPSAAPRWFRRFKIPCAKRSTADNYKDPDPSRQLVTVAATVAADCHCSCCRSGSDQAASLRIAPDNSRCFTNIFPTATAFFRQLTIFTDSYRISRQVLVQEFTKFNTNMDHVFSDEKRPIFSYIPTFLPPNCCGLFMYIPSSFPYPTPRSIPLKSRSRVPICCFLPLATFMIRTNFADRITKILLTATQFYPDTESYQQTPNFTDRNT